MTPLVGWLRIEAIATLGASLYLYNAAEGSWLLFAILFLLPDLSMVGYIWGPHAGGRSYNVAHSYTGSIAAAGSGIAAGNATILAVGLIWTAHIAFDRALGYGLKLPSGFQDTHLGRIGRRG